VGRPFHRRPRPLHPGAHRQRAEHLCLDGSRETVLGEPGTRRFREQRWLIDNTIRSVGMDWDQPRSIYLSAPCGPEANADFAAIRQRITKLADAAPAFEAVARRREAKARAAEQNGDLVTARDSYFM